MAENSLAEGMKTRIKAARLDHDLHVALLMKRDKLSKPDAIVMAYLDGLEGLQDRLDGVHNRVPPSMPPK